MKKSSFRRWKDGLYPCPRRAGNRRLENYWPEAAAPPPLGFISPL